MKSRFSVVVLAFLVVIGVLMWTIVRDRRTAVALAASVASGDQSPKTLTIQVQTLPPPPAPAAPSPRPEVAQQPPVIAPPAPAPVMPQQPPVAPGPTIDVDGVTPAGSVVKSKYTAQLGDTVSNLAAALPGGNQKVNRDAVINANPSLQQNPDRVIAGKTYQMPAQASAPAPVAPAPAPESAVTHPPIAEAEPSEAVHELKYIARAGDSVSTLAAALLGSDTKENRDAIIGANAPLQADADRVIAGQTYRIPVRASQPLASAPAGEIQTAPRPTTQPDADHLVLAGSARELRYTAQPGDTVSTLATALLGSDTKENRDAIIDNNKSLKQDPDHVVAGKAYWIPAPMPIQP
jgi:hypothetical protein